MSKVPLHPHAEEVHHDAEGARVIEFLRRHPVVSTYLGGSGLYPELRGGTLPLRSDSHNKTQCQPIPG